jgi:hypothetical protein
MLFLVTGMVCTQWYGEDDSKRVPVTRLVEAENLEKAEYKFDIFYRMQTSDYSVYYTTEQVSATEVIV